MKENHSSQNAQESGTSSFTRLRSKLSFERMVEMGAKMGMENPLFLCHERAAKATTVINGKEYINFSTYDYLDLNTHPEITEAVTEAAKVFGSSAGASRLVGGERPPHRQLERALADFYGVEDCIAYVSGHATNVSTLGFLFGHRDAIFYDGLAHNSLMQGARLSGADRYSYEHNDCDALEKMLKEHRGKHKRACIVTEGLFSMDGNIPDLPRIIELKKKYDCMLLVDEAHSFGVLGATGRGVHEYFGIDANEVDMWMSTLSKAMCGCGGFIAGRKELVEYLKYGSPGFVFSVGMPPIVAAACHKALELMQREPERVHKLHHGQPHAVDLIARGDIDIVVNTPNDKKGAQDDSIIRKAAIRSRVFYVTTMAAARATIAGIRAVAHEEKRPPRSLQEFHALIREE